MMLSVSPSCAANVSVGPLPIEFNRNISIRVIDCDVTSRNVSGRIATVRGFCNVVLGASLNAPGVFALIPCVSTIRISSSNATLSGSLYRRVEPVLSAVFDSSISIRACIWDADAVSFGQMGRVVSFPLAMNQATVRGNYQQAKLRHFQDFFVARASIFSTF
jgi:hypothetical protein